MSEQDVPSEVRQLIAERIDSVVQLEILLQLLSAPEKTWSPDQIAKQLRIDPKWADGQLAELQARGLVAQPAPGVFQYGPATPELDQAVRMLDKAYTDRRVTVISLIFSKPVDKLRSFADAFRIRKDQTDG